ncbi:MAG: hypothetical protein JKY34_02285 [Kordiimonadaceae bacterium]|nr:hypothetical protein [Kordiimonadaceae bacterium]
MQVFADGPVSLYWSTIALAAIFIDLAIGGFLNGKIPNLNVALRFIANGIDTKLDRPGRSDSALKTRGFATLLLCLPLLYLLGTLLNQLAKSTSAGTAVALLALIPILGQKKGWLRHTQTGRELANDAHTIDPHGTAQNSTQRIILKFGCQFAPNLFVFCAWGFALLLPLLFLQGLLGDTIKNGVSRRPFLAYSRFAYELITLPVTIVISVLLALAHYYLPKTNLLAIKGFSKKGMKLPRSHFIPLNIVATGLGLSFQRKIESKLEGKNKLAWVGPENGRAKLTATDMRSVWLVVLVAYGLSLILLMMLWFYLIVDVLK